MKFALGILLNLYLFLSLVCVLVFSHWQSPQEINLPIANLIQPDIPDFEKFTNTQEKKQQFFNYFAPIVVKENQRILERRDSLKKIHHKLSIGKQLSIKEIRELESLATAYKVNSQMTPAKISQTLLIRVNTVPVSLALAQAANESAWGTSRFAKKGNNYFGQWCFSRGCGLVPLHRSPNSKHEVRVFNTPEDSVKAYMRNINSHAAYEDLRQLRTQAEKEGIFAGGLLLAEGLISYSERGHAYVDEIQSMIESNQLETLDSQYNIGTR